jgi:hypothetical protein
MFVSCMIVPVTYDLYESYTVRTTLFMPSCIVTDQIVFENRVLRRIFGPKRDEVTGG